MLQIGLAVGDIEAIQRDARLKRLAMQVVNVLRETNIYSFWESGVCFIKVLMCMMSVLCKG